MVVKHGILACQFVEEMSNLMNCEVTLSFSISLLSSSLLPFLLPSFELNLFSLKYLPFWCLCLWVADRYLTLPSRHLLQIPPVLNSPVSSVQIPHYRVLVSLSKNVAFIFLSIQWGPFLKLLISVHSFFQNLNWIGFFLKYWNAL